MSKFILSLCAIILSSLSNADAKTIVAITKIAPHPSLDTIEKGIMDELKNSGIDVEFQRDNAQGNIITSVQIAKKYAGLKPALIIPIATPSAQTVYQAAFSENIPVVYAAVSDPVAAKLIDAKTQMGKNITGVSDLSPVVDQVDLIKNLQPSAKEIGILYNPGETNSTVLADLFKKEAATKGFKITLFPCTSLIDLVTVTKRIQGKVDALYIPNDNTIISGLNIVLSNLKEVPVYSADPESVAKGCLGSVAMEQYQIGLEVGKLAVRVLKGEDPSTIPAVQAEKVQITLNQQVAARLKIEIPSVLKKTAITLGD